MAVSSEGWRLPPLQSRLPGGQAASLIVFKCLQILLICAYKRGMARQDHAGADDIIFHGIDTRPPKVPRHIGHLRGIYHLVGVNWCGLAPFSF